MTCPRKNLLIKLILSIQHPDILGKEDVGDYLNKESHPSKKYSQIMYNFHMSKYYTKTGDDGTSGLLGNIRVPKNHPKLEAIGTIDEANAILGVIRAQIQNSNFKRIIITIQHDLYNIMSEISATQENMAKFRKMDENRVTWLEAQVEQLGNQIDMPREFIIPGDTLIGAFSDFARTVVRRAERQTSGLYHNSELENKYILAYLNRLSTFCFLYELYETKDKAVDLSLVKNIPL